MKTKNFIDIFIETAGDAPGDNDIIAGLTMLDEQCAKYRTLEGLAKTKIEKDAVGFLDWFYKSFGDDPDVFETIRSCWPYEPPVVFSIAESVIEGEMISTYSEAYDKLSAKEKTNVDHLYEYIFNHPLDRWITVSSNDGTVTEFLEKEDKSEKAEKILRSIIAMFYCENGSLVYRRKNDEKIYVNGFRIDDDGNIEILSSKELQKYCSSTDGTESTNDVYERAPIIFARA